MMTRTVLYTVCRTVDKVSLGERIGVQMPEGMEGANQAIMHDRGQLGSSFQKTLSLASAFRRLLCGE